MSSFRSSPRYAKYSDGSVINVRVIADKKDDFFVTGFFNGSSDPGFCPFDGFNFLKSDCSDFVRPQIVHVLGESEESFGSKICKLSVSVFDYPYSAGRKDVLPVEDRIINQVLLSIGRVRDGETLDKHDDSSGVFYFSEGFETAKALCSRFKSGPQPAR